VRWDTNGMISNGSSWSFGRLSAGR
jgi:hypothetical protein